MAINAYSSSFYVCLKEEILIVQFYVQFFWHHLEFGFGTLRKWTSYIWKVLCSSLSKYCKMGTESMLWSIFPICYLPWLCAPRFCTHHCSMPVFGLCQEKTSLAFKYCVNNWCCNSCFSAHCKSSSLIVFLLDSNDN